MAQLNSGDWPLSGNEVGADFVDKMATLFAGMMSNWSGTTRMPEVADGGLWSREELNGTHTLMMFSRGYNVPLLRSTTGGGVTAQHLYTKTEVDNLITAVAADVAALGEVPVGGIIMWSGVTPPSRYVICNGSNGTPDLRARFIVGSGGEYSVGETGGVRTQTQVPRHSHSFSGRTGDGGNHNHGGSTTSAGAHTHGLRVHRRNIDGDDDEGDGTVSLHEGHDGGYLTTEGNHAHGIYWSGNHDHAFSGTTADTGAAGGVDNRPPFYALAFIMRIS